MWDIYYYIITLIGIFPFEKMVFSFAYASLSRPCYASLRNHQGLTGRSESFNLHVSTFLLFNGMFLVLELLSYIFFERGSIAF